MLTHPTCYRNANSTYLLSVNTTHLLSKCQHNPLYILKYHTRQQMKSKCQKRSSFNIYVIRISNVCHSVWLPACLPVRLTVCMWRHVSVCMCVCICVCLYLHRPTCSDFSAKCDSDRNHGMPSLCGVPLSSSRNVLLMCCLFKMGPV